MGGSVTMAWLVNCEKSGVLRRALQAHGIDAWSCDLEPADDGEPFRHLQMDAIEAAYAMPWDGMIAHPECRFLSASGLHWNTRPGYEWRAAETEKAVQFALALWRAPIKVKILENPRGRLGPILRNAQRRYVAQPYQFGDDASKETFLWCDNIELEPIDPAWRLPGRIVNGKERWANQTDTGQNRLGPSPERSAKRAETYPGIANWIARSVARWCKNNA